MATRIISWEGLRLTAGVGIPFIPETGQALVENFKWLYDQKKDQMDWDKMMRRHSNRFYLEYKRSSERILFV
ncbi:MAG: hypothetical protein IPN90_00395 [Elusimicrobia bacterium]|nr:hypothetical protein [Elusimicrobiota bacterium]